MFYTFYRYVFYKLYVWSKKRWGTYGDPHINAVFLLGIIIWFNILLLPGVILLILFNDITVGYWPKLVAVGFLILIVISVYFQFSYNGKHIKIKNEFKNENNSKRITGNIIVTVYVIGSIILPFLLMMLTFKAKG